MSVFLFDVPEYRRCRPGQNTSDRFPPDARRVVLTKRDIGDLLIGERLDISGELFLLVVRCRASKLVTQRFHLRIIIPAEPAALRTFAGNRHVANWIETRAKTFSSQAQYCVPFDPV